MTKAKATTPPADTNGEARRALLALERCRREISDKAQLSPEWQRWVIESLQAGAPVTDSEHDAA